MRGNRNKVFFPLLAGALLLSVGIYRYLARNTEPDKTEIDLYFHALRAYEQGDLSRAVTLAETLCSGNPRFYQARLLLAKACFFSDACDEAEEQLRELLKDQEAFTEAGIWLLRTLIQRENLEEAAAYGEELLGYSPADPRVLALLGRIAWEKKDLQRALEYYRRAVLFEEDQAIIRLETAKIYLQLLHTEEAVAHLKRALVLFSEASPLRHAVDQLLKECEVLVLKKGEIQ